MRLARVSSDSTPSNDACAPGETARSPSPSLPQTHSEEACPGVSQVLYVCTPCGLSVTSATLPKCDDRSTSTYCLLGMRSSLGLALRTDSTPWIQWIQDMRGCEIQDRIQSRQGEMDVVWVEDAFECCGIDSKAATLLIMNSMTSRRD